jgi:hypothetical protein
MIDWVVTSGELSDLAFASDNIANPGWASRRKALKQAIEKATDEDLLPLWAGILMSAQAGQLRG